MAAAVLAAAFQVKAMATGQQHQSESIRRFAKEDIRGTERWSHVGRPTG